MAIDNAVILEYSLLVSRLLEEGIVPSSFPSRIKLEIERNLQFLKKKAMTDIGYGSSDNFRKQYELWQKISNSADDLIDLGRYFMDYDARYEHKL